ncbi:NAD(P)H-quinone oxidoreductase [Blastomonas sp. AAP53]|uniref:NAD(P)H-quinone oxidoreductase n=1 Tax=Blastomonas sp. AAP53 TaxID=1248760 RepID=UPI000476699B|nr:NAD(P)H-quinone oxidoreductase [Blastomonas sp. AAP53]
MATVIPATMQAIDYAEPGGPEVLVSGETAVPVPGEGEVLVRVAAAGVNRPDVIQRQGFYPPPPGAPHIPGLEIAGTIVAVGPDTNDALIGQPVCALVAGGGYAEYCVARADHCLTIPSGISMAEAAALPETLFTVWHNLFQRGYARDGETVLVHGGTSGIGTMAIKLGKLFDLTVIVTCGSDDKCDAALGIGAAHAINYKTHDFVEEVTRLTGGKGVEIVLDMVGGSYLPRNMACLADDGRNVTIAVQGGMKAEISVLEIMRRRLTLTGSTLRPRSNAFKALLADEISREVWPLVATGELSPLIHSRYPLAEAAQAHAQMESGDLVGKIVLEIG